MNLKTLLTATAAILAAAAFADDEESSSETEATSTEESAEAQPAASEEEAQLLKLKKQKEAAFFTLLPSCRSVVGTVEVLRPGHKQWAPAEEGKFYSLGTTYRTRDDGQLTLAFGKDSTVQIEGNASFGTRSGALKAESRTVELKQGVLKVRVPRNLPEGKLFIVSPGMTAKNLAGESTYTYKDMGDGDEVIIACVTGGLAVEGRHFEVVKMASANEFSVRTSRDCLVSILRGLRGDVAVKLDKGMIDRTEINEDGVVQHVIEKGIQEWRLSPKTRVQINRAVPSIGKRMSVTMTVFNSQGTPVHNFAYSEGRAEVNTGELIPQSKPKTTAELAKRAEENGAGDGEEASKSNEDGENSGNEESNTTESEEEEE